MAAYHDVIFMYAEQRDGQPVICFVYKRFERKDFFNKAIIESVINLRIESVDSARDALQNREEFLAYLDRELVPQVKSYLKEHRKEELKSLCVERIDSEDDLQRRVHGYLVNLAESPLEIEVKN